MKTKLRKLLVAGVFTFGVTISATALAECDEVGRQHCLDQMNLCWNSGGGVQCQLDYYACLRSYGCEEP